MPRWVMNRVRKGAIPIRRRYRDRKRQDGTIIPALRTRKRSLSLFYPAYNRQVHEGIVLCGPDDQVGSTLGMWWIDLARVHKRPIHRTFRTEWACYWVESKGYYG
ncbi:hypothetical protein V565_105820 [Rhizoctonia solani 123E]|uniref:Uncharacterized protein n=1 Tax=Rhizoctonia solani 123E TaxID=1423351 RepID=A0A074SGQ0_9AGAM|nr:hypothetical protein V565_105820 [Rhizoctonia solani 123E]